MIDLRKKNQNKTYQRYISTAKHTGYKLILLEASVLLRKSADAPAREIEHSQMVGEVRTDLDRPAWRVCERCCSDINGIQNSPYEMR